MPRPSRKNDPHCGCVRIRCNRLIPGPSSVQGASSQPPKQALASPPELPIEPLLLRPISLRGSWTLPPGILLEAPGPAAWRVALQDPMAPCSLTASRASSFTNTRLSVRGPEMVPSCAQLAL
ncbi:hypothetical protein N7492_010383 [Penicillium capsulatum]|uniref:Uncharacterized protein n=1 Tax=Penicillium capsulatum TaxID=69766 RepID=A0A9W9HL65_9EURO|nr:hypothetical protein N7492_010383 [Penicillium capsulatum]